MKEEKTIDERSQKDRREISKWSMRDFKKVDKREVPIRRKRACSLKGVLPYLG